jgi:hypothetical protein
VFAACDFRKLVVNKDGYIRRARRRLERQRLPAAITLVSKVVHDENETKPFFIF